MIKDDLETRILDALRNGPLTSHDISHAVHGNEGFAAKSIIDELKKMEAKELVKKQCKDVYLKI